MSSFGFEKGVSNLIEFFDRWLAIMYVCGGGGSGSDV